MTERKEKIRSERISFFDADDTLWKTVPETYASEGIKAGMSRTFSLAGDGSVVRNEDGAKFILKEDVKETLQRLSSEGVSVGMISDNDPKDVEEICKLLDIWESFDESLVNIRFWEGPADKTLMISEVLGIESGDKGPEVLLIDDSERYAQQMISAGYNFILSPKDSFPGGAILDFFGLKN